MASEHRSHPAQLEPASVLVRRPDVLATELSSRELVMLDIEGGTYFGVEGVARLVWEALSAPLTLAEVVDRVRVAFPDVDPQACDREVRAFVADLVRHRLVRVAAAADSV